MSSDILLEWFGMVHSPLSSRAFTDPLEELDIERGGNIHCILL